jgi:hypothetical protein
LYTGQIFLFVIAGSASISTTWQSLSKVSNYYGSDKLIYVAHSRDGLSYFFLDKKVTKKSSQQRGFSRTGHAAQSEENLGCNLFPLLRSLMAIASGKN